MTVTGIALKTNKKHQVSEVFVTFSGPVNVTEADNTATYRLATPGKHGSYTARNAGIIKLKSATYDPTDDQVTLVPKKPFVISKKVQLEVIGTPPSGLQDGAGRYIDGANNGQAGGNAVAILSKGGVSIDAMTLANPSAGPNTATNEIDVLLAQSELDRLVHSRSAKKHPG